MTQKELLYVEDAIGHEQNIIKILTYYLDYINDLNVRDYIKDEIGKHVIQKDNLINLLEAKTNE